MNKPYPFLVAGELPASMDYNRLREEGLELIRKLAGETWTDHNAHDPGITALEAWCYALTELAYRVNLPVEQLLGPLFTSRVFTAPEALPMAPLTLNDRRKVLLDLNIQPEAREALYLLDVFFRENTVFPYPLYFRPTTRTLSFTNSDPDAHRQFASKLFLDTYYTLPEALSLEAFTFSFDLQVNEEIIRAKGWLHFSDTDLKSLLAFYAKEQKETQIRISGNRDTLVVADVLKPQYRYYLRVEIHQNNNIVKELAAFLDFVISSNGIIQEGELAAPVLDALLIEVTKLEVPNHLLRRYALQKPPIVAGVTQKIKRKLSFTNSDPDADRQFIPKVFFDTYYTLPETLSLEAFTFSFDLKVNEENIQAKGWLRFSDTDLKSLLAFYTKEQKETQIRILGDRITLVEFADLLKPQYRYYLRIEIRQNNTTVKELTAFLDFVISVEGVLLEGELPLSVLDALLVKLGKLESSNNPLRRYVQQKLPLVASIEQKIKRRLHQQRNLCEDVATIKPVKNCYILVNAQIGIAPRMDAARVLAAIQSALAREIRPAVSPTDYEEALNRGIPTEKLYDGPLLYRGYMPSSQLSQARSREVLYVSDLVRTIMAVEGVRAIIEISINYQTTEEHINIPTVKIKPNSEFQSDKLELPEGDTQPVFDALHSRLRLQVLESDVFDLEAENKIDTKVPLPPVEQQIEKLDLNQYYSIQEDFSPVFKLREGELMQGDSFPRQAVAHQFKGYLMVLEHLLGNAAAQLAIFPWLYDMRMPRCVPEAQWDQLAHPLQDLFLETSELKLPSDSFQGRLVKGIQQTLTGQPLYKVPGAEALVKDFDPDKKPWEEFKADSNNDYITGLKEATEDADLFANRHGKLLAHLLGRLGEDTAAYGEWTSYSYPGQQEGLSREAADVYNQMQLRFLESSLCLNHNRGLGINYTLPSCGQGAGSAEHKSFTVNEINISGLKKRICKRLGLLNCQNRRPGDLERSHLVIFEETDRIEDGIYELWFRIKSEEGEPVLTSDTRYLNYSALKKQINLVLKYGKFLDHYSVFQSDRDKEYYYHLQDDQSEILANRKGKGFKSEEDAIAAIKGVIALIRKIKPVLDEEMETLFLIEHILLLPRKKPSAGQGHDKKLILKAKNLNNSLTDNLLLAPQIVYEEGALPITVKDPYSYRISILLPKEIGRFKDPEFRRLTEEIIKEECPAHIIPGIYWLRTYEFLITGQAWCNWLGEFAKEKEEDLNHLRGLVSVLNGLNSKPNRDTGLGRKGVLAKIPGLSTKGDNSLYQIDNPFIDIIEKTTELANGKFHLGFQFRPKDNHNIYLANTEEYQKPDDLLSALKEVQVLGKEDTNYKITPSKDDQLWRVELRTKEGHLIANQGDKAFENEALAIGEKERIKSFFQRMGTIQAAFVSSYLWIDHRFIQPKFAEKYLNQKEHRLNKVKYRNGETVEGLTKIYEGRVSLVFSGSLERKKADDLLKETEERVQKTLSGKDKVGVYWLDTEDFLRLAVAKRTWDEVIRKDQRNWKKEHALLIKEMNRLFENT